MRKVASLPLIVIPPSVPLSGETGKLKEQEGYRCFLGRLPLVAYRPALTPLYRRFSSLEFYVLKILKIRAGATPLPSLVREQHHRQHAAAAPHREHSGEALRQLTALPVYSCRISGFSQL